MAHTHTPTSGMILSTRESAETRRELLKLGISQMSAGQLGQESSALMGTYHHHVPVSLCDEEEEEE